MRKSVFIQLAIVLVTLLVVSCGKDEDVTLNRDVILNGNTEVRWKLQTLTVNGVDGKGTYLDTCSLDDILVFKSDDTYQVEQGVELCDTSNKEVVLREGLWEISEHQDTLYLLPTDNSKAIKAVLEDVESTRIIYTLFDDSGDQVEYTYFLE